MAPRKSKPPVVAVTKESAQMSTGTNGAPTKCWLMKSEPDEFSWEDLMAKDNHTGCWDGVRNAQARNFMRSMALKDKVLFYYSSCKQPRVVGVAEVAKLAYPDYTAWDPKHKYHDPKSSKDVPKWDMVDVRGLRPLRREVTLEEMRTHSEGELSGMLLFSRSRLSIQPVSPEHWDFIMSLSESERSEEEKALKRSSTKASVEREEEVKTKKAVSGRKKAVEVDEKEVAEQEDGNGNDGKAEKEVQKEKARKGGKGKQLAEDEAGREEVEKAEGAATNTSSPEPLQKRPRRTAVKK